MLRNLLALLLIVAASDNLLAQSLEFCKRADGRANIDIVYEGDSAHPKMSNMSYYTCCLQNPNPPYSKLLNKEISAWVKNTDSVSVNAYMELEVNYVWNPITIKSDTVLLMPGDSALLISPSFNSIDGATLSIFGNQTLQLQDSISSNDYSIDNGSVSSYFGDVSGFWSFHNSGSVIPGQSLAFLVPLDQEILLKSMDIYANGNGGSIGFSIYDSSTFNPQVGFTGSPIYNSSITIYGSTPKWYTYHFSNLTIPDKRPGIVDYYWVEVQIFAGPIDTLGIGYSQKILPAPNTLWFSTDLTTFQPFRDATFDFGNPMVKFNVFIPHIDPFGIGFSERELEEISVYPNPAKEIFHIDFPDGFPKGGTRLELFDTSGKLILSKKLKTQNPVPLQTIEKGVYILKVQLGDSVFIQKFIKE